MPIFRKRKHESIRDAVAETFDESSRDDCAHIAFETTDGEHTIQYVNRDLAVHNVTHFDNGRRRKRVLDEVDLGLLESPTDDGYVLYVSEAETIGDVIEEMSRIAEACGGSLNRENVTEIQSFAASKPTLIGNLTSILGWG